MPQKLAVNLQLNDEFEIIHDRSVKRCFVASIPVIDGNTIKFKIHPVCKRWIRNKLRLVKFSANTTIDVFAIRDNRAVDKRRVYQQEILKMLGFRPISTPQIKAALATKYGKACDTTLRLALRGLMFTKRVIGKTRETPKKGKGRTDLMKYYRLPLSSASDRNLFVIEERGRSQRIGWIEGWQEHRSTENLQPMVRFLQPDGTTISTFSQETFLEILPVSNQFLYRQVQLAKKRHEGQSNHPPIEIPAEMLRRLHEASTHTYKGHATTMNAHRKVLLEIAKHLQWIDEYTDRWHFTTEPIAVQTLDHLWTYYPGWRNGRLSA